MHLTRFLTCFAAILVFALGAVGLPGQQAAQNSPSSSQPAQKNLAEPVDRNAAQHRAEWFHNHRAYPRSSIPPAVRAQAVQHSPEMAARKNGLSEAAAAESPPLPILRPQSLPICHPPI